MPPRAERSVRVLGVERTIVRRLDTTAMLVGPAGPAADAITAAFERVFVTVVRAAHTAAACERLAVAMPQVVVVLGALHPEEHDALADRATAVGALVIHVDPSLDGEALEDLVGRAAQAAVERKLRRDESGPAGTFDTNPPPSAEEIDAGWGDSN